MAFRFAVWDRSVPSSEISNFQLLLMTSGTSAFLLLKLASDEWREVEPNQFKAKAFPAP